MTLREALKTKFRFKRSGSPFWCYSDNFHIYYVDHWNKTIKWELYVSDLLADDYIIEEPKVEITKSDFIKAYTQVLEEWGSDRVVRPAHERMPYEGCALRIMKKLGIDW